MSIEPDLQQLRDQLASRRYDELLHFGAQILETRGSELGARDRASVHRELGMAAVELGDDTLGASSLATAWSWDPTDRRVGTAYGRLLFRTGRGTEGAAVFEGVLVHSGDDLATPVQAALLRALAAHYLAAGDLEAARARIEVGLDAAPLDPQLLDLLGRVFEESGQLERATEIWRQSIAHTADHAERAARVIDLADALNGDGRSDEAYDLLVQAAEGFDGPLDAAPTSLRLFELQTSLLAHARAWELLHSAYQRMVDRTDADQPSNIPLLSLLWRNMGDISSAKLMLESRAADEWARSAGFKFHPAEDPVAHQESGVYAEVSPISTLWREIISTDEWLPLAERYGHALMQSGDRDAGFVVLDTVLSEGGGTHATRVLVDSLRPDSRPRRFHMPLTDELRNRFVRPIARRAALDAVFHVAFHLVGDAFCHDPRDYDLSPRDALSPDDPLRVTRLVRKLSADLGFPRPPTVYVYRQVRGLSSTFFREPSLLVGPDMLGDLNEPDVRFQLGQLLTMMQPRFFLAALLEVDELGAVVTAITGTPLRHQTPAAQAMVERVVRTLTQRRTDAWEGALEDVTRRIVQDEREPDVEAWLAYVSAEAARTGLICAQSVGDSLASAERFGVLRRPVASRARRSDLALYAMSPEHMRLRGALGVAIDAAALDGPDEGASGL